MPIRQRKAPLAVEPDDSYRGRHPMLKHGSTHFSIWNYVHARPNSTVPEVKRALSIGHQRIQELISEGLLVYGPTKRLIVNGKARDYPTLVPNEKRAVGSARTRVQVKLTLLRNEDGEYSVESQMLGQLPSALIGLREKVLEKTVTLIAPKAAEADGPATGSCVVDAEYVIIDSA